MTPPRVHDTAIVEDGAQLGARTSVWDNAHIRSGAKVGSDCIVGEKTYLAGGVVVGDRVKLNAFVYLPYGVTLENAVMVGAGAVFTNDRNPRATTPELDALRPSEAGEHTLPTTVREGATVGAGAIVGPGVEIGRFAMVGMGAVVTRSVADHHVVVGNPARPVGLACRCGQLFHRFTPGAPADVADAECPACGRRYTVADRRVVEG